MKDIPGVQSSFRVWFVLVLSVFLLCGFLTGCHNRDSEEQDTGKTEMPSVDTHKDEQSLPDNTRERLNTLLQNIENLAPDTGTDTVGNIYLSEYATPIESLKKLAREEENAKALLQEIIEAISPLRDKAESLRGDYPDLKPTSEEWTTLLNEATALSLITPLDARIERMPTPEPISDVEMTEVLSAIGAAQNAVESMFSTSESNLQTDLTKLQDSVDGLRKSVSLTTFLSALFSAAGLISMVVVIFMIQQQKAMIQEQTRIMQSSNKKQKDSYHSPYKTSAYPGDYVPSRRDSEAAENRANATAGWSNPYGTLDEKTSQETAETSSTNQVALSGVSSAGTNGFAPTAPQPTLLTLKLDAKKQNPLKKDEVWLASTIPPSEFSGEATDVPDEYRIWPDPRNRGIQSQHSQEISRQNLYFGYVKACFDITPPSAGNYQSFVIQVETCATVRKSGNSYQLISKGKIRAQGST